MTYTLQGPAIPLTSKPSELRITTHTLDPPPSAQRTSRGVDRGDRGGVSDIADEDERRGGKSYMQATRARGPSSLGRQVRRFVQQIGVKRSSNFWTKEGGRVEVSRRVLREGERYVQYGYFIRGGVMYKRAETRPSPLLFARQTQHDSYLPSLFGLTSRHPPEKRRFGRVEESGGG